MIILPLHDSFININKLEQRLIQIFAYFIGTQFLNELMYLGMDYTFKFSNTLNLENIKGNFYISSLLGIKNLINSRLLFRQAFKNSYITTTYSSFNLFKNFYSIINKINPILNILDFIIQVGARSNKLQYQQIVGTRGFLNTSRGYLTNKPLLHNFERGLNLTEYLISSYGVRKGLLDTGLQTSESGYLTRRLVEVIQDIVVKEHYCGSDKLLILRKYNTIHGHIKFPESQLLFSKYLYTSNNQVEFYIKSPLLCYSGRSICSKCSGFSCNLKILGGESLGVICGELLGEPSTQLTLRTFHTGGILNITNGNKFYTFKYKKVFDIYLSKFKLISFKTKKNLMSKFKNNLFNKSKYMPLQKFSQPFINIKNKIYKYNSNIILKYLIIYKFNLILPPYNLKNHSLIVPHIYKILIPNFLLNVYSINILLKNTLTEWAMLLLNNSLDYYVYDYVPEKFIGGISLNQNNLKKSSIICNTTIIY